MKTAEKMAEEYRIWILENEHDEVEKPGGHLSIAFLAGYQAAQQWISVKERLPEDNLEVLFFSQEYDGCFVGYKAAEGSYVDPESNGLSVSNIQKYYTYWRLLPEPPEEKK